MRCAKILAFGDESNVAVVDEEIAEPTGRDVQVAVEYSEFSGADINMRRGTYPFQRKAPLTPGYTVVGTVRRNGPRAGRFRPGDRVVCLSIYGGEATLANLPERHLYPVPSGVDSGQAACLILDWLTAYQLLFRAAGAVAGQSVFVHGLSGAVGRGLLGLATLRGIRVYGTASERQHDALRALGATPFAYSDKRWIDAMRAAGGVDAAFDPLGFESFDESFSILNEQGILVGFGINLPAVTKSPPRNPLPMLAKLVARNLALWSRKRATFFGLDRRSKHFAEDLRTLLDLASTGEISVPIKATYDLDDVPQAHRNWSAGNGMGSVLIRVGASPGG